MKTQLQGTIFIIAAFVMMSALLSACGGSDFNERGAKLAEEVMILGQGYTIYEGDLIRNDSHDVTIEVVHNQATDIRVVTLLTGDATLLRGDFVLAGGH